MYVLCLLLHFIVIDVFFYFPTGSSFSMSCVAPISRFNLSVSHVFRPIVLIVHYYQLFIWWHRFPLLVILVGNYHLRSTHLLCFYYISCLSHMYWDVKFSLLAPLLIVISIHLCECLVISSSPSTSLFLIAIAIRPNTFAFIS